jgi:hypothetical protein
MKITSLKELIDRGQTEGAILPGVDYLTQTPGAFIELAKQDIVLAANYAIFFNFEHIEKIAQINSKLFTSLYLLTQNPGIYSVYIIKTPLGLNDKNILSYMDKIKSMFQFTKEYEDSWSPVRPVLYQVIFQGKTAFYTDKDYNFNSMKLIDYAVCELAYKNSTHVQDIKKIIKDIVSKMLEKLKNSKIKENIIDKEFAEEFFSLFTKKYYLIDSVVENKDYEWLEKLSTCMSKITLTEQLEKSQQRMGALSTEVSKKFDELIALKEMETATNNVPNAPPVYEVTPREYLDALARIAELEQEMVNLKLQLKTAQLKSENLPSTLSAYTKSTSEDLGSSKGHSQFSYQ